MQNTCQVCGNEVDGDDYCPLCIEGKVLEFKKNWRWLTPQNKRCKSSVGDERCPFLAVEDSEYCPSCRRRYDDTIRCEYVLPTGKRCTQFKQKGHEYCWTHIRHLEKLNESKMKGKLNQVLNRIKAGELDVISYQDIVELVMFNHIDSQTALVITAAKFLETYLCRGESDEQEGTTEG